MKIGIDARLWHETGVGRYLRNLVFHLQKIDTTNDYTLFVQPGATARTLGITATNWRLIETNIHWHSLREQLQFPLVIEKAHVDLMHFPYFSVPIFYTRPFIVTIHDLILHHFATGEATTRTPLFYQVKRLGYARIIKTAAHMSKKIITVSHSTKEEIIDHLNVPEEKVVVTYEGVDDAFFSPTRLAVPHFAHKQSFHPDRDRFFLVVGNAYPHKNLDRLLLAYKDVHEKHKTVKFVFVGKEDFFTKRLREKVKTLALDDSVLFLGEIRDEVLRYLYTRALALLMPSLMEGFGLPPLEAMSQKGLVAVSDIPVFREVYKKGAVYYDPYAPEKIAACLHAILAHPEHYTAIRSYGYEQSQQFSWGKMAQETKAVYESLI